MLASVCSKIRVCGFPGSLFFFFFFDTGYRTQNLVLVRQVAAPLSYIPGGPHDPSLLPSIQLSV